MQPFANTHSSNGGVSIVQIRKQHIASQSPPKPPCTSRHYTLDIPRRWGPSRDLLLSDVECHVHIVILKFGNCACHRNGQGMHWLLRYRKHLLLYMIVICCIFHVATIHPLKFKFDNVIPMRGGRHIFANTHTTKPRPWPAQIASISKWFGNVQKSWFGSILAAEGLRKSEFAFPLSTGITQTNGSHRAWGCMFWFVEHPSRENANNENQVLQELMSKQWFWDINKHKITVERLKKSTD